MSEMNGHSQNGHSQNGHADSGGRGEGPHLSPVQSNKIVAMMLNPNRRWKISKAAKREALATTINNMGDEDGRVRNAAVANLIRMEAQNLQDQHKLLDKLAPDKHEHNHKSEEIKQLLDELRADDQFVAQQYSGAIPTNGHAGPHGYFGQPGQVDDGGTPPTD